MLDPNIAGLVMVAVFIVLLLNGMPIAYALLTAGVVGLAGTRSWPSLEFLLSTFSHSRSANLAYVVLPLFLFMGYMAFAAGVAAKAYAAARAIFGSLPGGLGVATVFACAAFAAVTGSSVATSATMAQIAVPEMRRYHYSERIAAATVTAGGTLGVLIPPAGILIVYSISTGIPITDLFRAAVVPGIVTAVAYACLLVGWVWLDKELRVKTRVPPTPMRERGFAILAAWEVLLILGVVMGTIFLGLGTATEAAAFGAACSLLVVIFRRKGERKKILWRGLVDTGVTTSSIFVLIIGASLFGLALSTTQIPQHLITWIGGFDVPRWGIVLMLLVPYLLLGCFIDGLSLLLITLPIVLPVLKATQIDPILFGILVAKTVEIGAIHPPIGLNAFVVKNALPDVRLSEIFIGCIPFVVIELLLIAALILFPEALTGRAL